MDFAIHRKPKYTDLKGLYFKQNNKWWDGYNHQRAVLLDELDLNMNTWIMCKLKQWCDKIPLYLEIKGGTCPALYTNFTVTC